MDIIEGPKAHWSSVTELAEHSNSRVNVAVDEWFIKQFFNDMRGQWVKSLGDIGITLDSGIFSKV